MKASTENPVRRKIIDLSFYAFNQKGYRGVPMDLVARELRISKKTIYVHFHSKEEILETAMEELFSKVNRDMNDALAHKDEQDALVAVFEVYKDFYHAFSPRLRAEIKESMPFLDDRYAAFEKRVIHNKISKWLKALRKQKKLSYPSPTRDWVSTLLHAMRGMVDSPPDMVHHLLQFLVLGKQIGKKKKK